MAKNDNLVHYLTDIADAIREKNGTSDPINAQDFAEEIKNGGGNSGSSKWTGHADAEGLKAIGWTDEDIAYYQEHGVNWNAEDDEYHKVSEDNKALYGVLTADNISDYAERIVYLPKIDTSGVDEMYGLLYYCKNIVAVPSLDLSNCTDLSYAFNGPIFLTSCSPFDTSKAEIIDSLFEGNKGLLVCPEIDLNKSNICFVFCDCYSLEDIKVKEIEGATNIGSMFSGCYSLKSIPLIDMSGVTVADYAFSDCFSLVNAKLKNLKVSISFAQSPCLSKESLLYIINNEAATSPIVITLVKYSAYERLSVDPDIVAALANHPNVSLAK